MNILTKIKRWGWSDYPTKEELNQMKSLFDTLVWELNKKIATVDVSFKEKKTIIDTDLEKMRKDVFCNKENFERSIRNVESTTAGLQTSLTNNKNELKQSISVLVQVVDNLRLDLESKIRGNAKTFQQVNQELKESTQVLETKFSLQMTKIDLDLRDKMRTVDVILKKIREDVSCNKENLERSIRNVESTIDGLRVSLAKNKEELKQSIQSTEIRLDSKISGLDAIFKDNNQKIISNSDAAIKDIITKIAETKRYYQISIQGSEQFVGNLRSDFDSFIMGNTKATQQISQELNKLKIAFAETREILTSHDITNSEQIKSIKALQTDFSLIENSISCIDTLREQIDTISADIKESKSKLLKSINQGDDEVSAKTQQYKDYVVSQISVMETIWVNMQEQIDKISELSTANEDKRNEMLTEFEKLSKEITLLQYFIMSGNQNDTVEGVNDKTQNLFALLNSLDAVTRKAKELESKILLVEGDVKKVAMQGDEIGEIKKCVAVLDSNTVSVLPIGTILSFASQTPPDDWRVCDGCKLSIEANKELFDVIGTSFGGDKDGGFFNLPDLRGKFVRGWDSDGMFDPERDFGSIQLDAFQGHGHEIPSHNHTASAVNDGAHSHSMCKRSVTLRDSSSFSSNNHTSYRVEDWSTYNSGYYTTGTTSSHTHAITIESTVLSVRQPSVLNCGQIKIDTETRPINIALLYCIKIK